MNKARILYIDDEIENLKVFKSVFKGDFDVTIEEFPLNAISLVKNSTFDIIVADQRMPALTGVKFFEEISSIIGNSTVKILLTGFSDMEAIIEAINRGRIYYYCTKPWKKEQLKAIFLKALEHINLVKRNETLIENLSRSVKELDTFLYKASHNLKSPITSQLGLLSLLKYENGTNDSTIIQKIQESIFVLHKTIDQMQAISSVSNEFIKDKFEIKPSEIVEEIVTETKDIIYAKNIQIEKNLDSTGEFFSDRNSLKNVLGSIIENAFTFTRQEDYEPIIKIYSKINNNNLEVVIEDNGSGIPSELIPKVCDAFFIADSRSKGSGLGLFVSKRICESLGGTLEIESKQGEGTRVKVIIPNMIN